MTRRLYILPFDHRQSFLKILGLDKKDLTADETASAADYKHLIYEGFLRALEDGVSKSAAAILVDEQFGSKIQGEARALGITRILTVEKSGQDEFDFEYGDKFGEHIDKFKPEYVKALVRYNPDGPQDLNRRQAQRLKIISDFCRQNSYGFLFELLAVPTPEQLAECHGNKDEYEKTKQFEVMIKSIAELQGAGVEPDVWKIEGLEDGRQLREVIGQVRRDGRDGAGVVVLGRGEEEEKVRRWIEVAAGTEGVIGFAVGRTVFAKPLADYRQKVISRAEAARTIAQNYKKFVDLFESADQA